MHASRATAVLVCLVSTTGLAACGNKAAKKKKQAESGDFTVSVTTSFPKQQALSENIPLSIKVKNTGQRPIPAVAVSLFDSQRDEVIQSDHDDTGLDAGLTHNATPTYLANSEPLDDTDALDTWGGGSIAPGKTANFKWNVSPEVTGKKTFNYLISPDLDGRGRAVLSSGQPAQGSIEVNIAKHPPATGE